MSKEKKEMIYEGKAKKVYSTDNADEIIVYYKDDATAFNGEKKGSIKDKGVMNNEITTLLFKMLEKNGVKTHFIEKLSDREQLCQKVKIFPLEVIVRNLIAGSMAKRLGIEEGTVPPNTIFEICYKNDAYGDPLINDHHAVALNLATYDELKYIYEVTSKVNNLLKEAIIKRDKIMLEDGKKYLEQDKELINKITPDTCRFWDKATGKKLDKDRFRRDLGSIEEAYIEVLNRLNNM